MTQSSGLNCLVEQHILPMTDPWFNHQPELEMNLLDLSELARSDAYLRSFDTRPTTPEEEEGEFMDISACSLPGLSGQPPAESFFKEFLLREDQDPMMWSAPSSPTKRTHSHSFCLDVQVEEDSRKRTKVDPDLLTKPQFNPLAIRACLHNPYALKDHSDYCKGKGGGGPDSPPDTDTEERTDNPGCSPGRSDAAAAGLPVAEDVPSPSLSGSTGGKKIPAAKASSGPAKASSGPAKASSRPAKASSAATKASSSSAAKASASSATKASSSSADKASASSATKASSSSADKASASSATKASSSSADKASASSATKASSAATKASSSSAAKASASSAAKASSSRPAKASSAATKASSPSAAKASASSAAEASTMNCKSLPKGKRGQNAATAKGCSSQGSTGHKGKREESEEEKKERLHQNALKEKERRKKAKELVEKVKNTLHRLCPSSLVQKASQQKVLDSLLSVLVCQHKILRKQWRVLSCT